MLSPEEEHMVHNSPRDPGAGARRGIASGRNDRLSQGLDLHQPVEVAPGNVKGPLFPSLRPLFETLGDRDTAEAA
jgi:hypothetical protein